MRDDVESLKQLLEEPLEEISKQLQQLQQLLVELLQNVQTLPLDPLTNSPGDVSIFSSCWFYCTVVMWVVTLRFVHVSSFQKWLCDMC